MPSCSIYINSLDRSISSKRGVWLVFITIMYIEITIFNVNRVDPDQTPILRPLIWIYTVCHCKFYRTLCINGLNNHKDIETD